MYLGALLEQSVSITLECMNPAPDPLKPVRTTWTDPELTVFGSIEVLTLGRNKNLGTGDAFTFENQSTRLSH
jgi:hypothetical protein